MKPIRIKWSDIGLFQCITMVIDQMWENESWWYKGTQYVRFKAHVVGGPRSGTFTVPLKRLQDAIYAYPLQKKQHLKHGQNIKVTIQKLPGRKMKVISMGEGI